MKLIQNVGRVLGTGHYLPERVVTNHELEQQVPTQDEWIVATLGIRERRIVAEGQTTADLSAEAGALALADAEVSASSVDMLIVATSTPDRKSPSTACLVHEKLGLGDAAAFDLQAVCSGFLYAFHLAQLHLSAGGVKRVLVIGADRFSSITDWSKRDCVFFGDGAGAAVLEGSRGPGLFVSRLFADGRGKDAFTVHTDDRFFSMDGKAVYSTGTTVLPEAIEQVLADAEVAIDDVTVLVPHQPSIGILEETARRIGLPFERVVTNMDRYANTSGGTIPIALSEAVQAGRIRPGDHVLFAAVGSGWTWGASIFRWI